MAKIKVLAPLEAQKIAAGEVIERPGHVVKELVENSIDAGASKISLFVEKAGKKLIRLVDNGCGMSAEDALLCVHSHATSKISTLDDLTSISTFGFRGEGLASIAAISNLTIRTRLRQGSGGQAKQDESPVSFDKLRTSDIISTNNSQSLMVSPSNHMSDTTATLGTHLYLEGGMLITNTTTACPVGTEMVVEDLFFNTPVRKKFLKQDETEWNQIQQLIHAYALLRKDIHFTLYHDGKLILNAPPVQTLNDRLTQLWEHNFAQNMMVLKEDQAITGAISNHHFWRYGRHHIFFFVNNRWVKNAELSKALLAGYRNVLPPGKFPAAFIFITVDPELVDVNVHPKKEEVRFAKQGVVLNLLETLVKNTLEQEVNKVVTPSIRASSPSPSLPQTPTYSYSPPPFPKPLQQEIHTPIAHFNPLPSFVHAPFKQPSIPPQFPLDAQHHEASPLQSFTSVGAILGQVLATYILMESEQGLTIIDQHAAHERILYEKMRANYEKKEGTQLLFPQIVNLSPHQIELLCHEQDFFVDQGIEFTQIGDDQVRITATPTDISGTSLTELISEIGTFLQENEFLDREIFRKRLNEHMHSHLACKTAVKAGDKLTMTEMHQLVSDLLKTEDRFRCIHGRPTFWVISSDELAKKFRRK